MSKTQINTQFINQLDTEIQNDIKNKVKESLLELELKDEELIQHLEEAMAGRVCDLSDLIDISKY